jgi:hypothetical protein
MDAFTATYQTPARTLIGRSRVQAGEPLHRRGYFAPIRQADSQGRGVAVNVYDGWTKLRDRNGHAMPPEIQAGFR